MFTPMLMEKLGVKVSPYMAMLTEIQQNLPAAERGRYMTQNGTYTKHLTKQQKQLERDYRLIQYDLTVGKQPK